MDNDAEQTEDREPGETFPWSDVTPGSTAKPLQINNTGLAAALYTLNSTPEPFPGGWQRSWDHKDLALDPKELRPDTQPLTVPDDVGAGQYALASWITAGAA